jgi:hypothetical protein
MPDEELEAFETLKTALCSDPVIAYPRSDRTFSLIVDEEEKGGLVSFCVKLMKKCTLGSSPMQVEHYHLVRILPPPHFN